MSTVHSIFCCWPGKQLWQANEAHPSCMLSTERRTTARLCKINAHIKAMEETAKINTEIVMDASMLVMTPCVFGPWTYTAHASNVIRSISDGIQIIFHPRHPVRAQLPPRGRRLLGSRSEPKKLGQRRYACSTAPTRTPALLLQCSWRCT